MSKVNFWDTSHATAGPLTAEDLVKAAEAIRNAPPHPCSLGQHVVSPKARYRVGWYPCGNCGQPVHITVPLSEVQVAKVEKHNG